METIVPEIMNTKKIRKEIKDCCLFQPAVHIRFDSKVGAFTGYLNPAVSF